jgi:hypothetical protein
MEVIAMNCIVHCVVVVVVGVTEDFHFLLLKFRMTTLARASQSFFVD